MKSNVAHQPLRPVSPRRNGEPRMFASSPCQPSMPPTSPRHFRKAFRRSADTRCTAGKPHSEASAFQATIASAIALSAPASLDAVTSLVSVSVSVSLRVRSTSVARPLFAGLTGVSAASVEGVSRDARALRACSDFRATRCNSWSIRLCDHVSSVTRKNSARVSRTSRHSSSVMRTMRASLRSSAGKALPRCQ
jgi:hypothetical protein